MVTLLASIAVGNDITSIIGIVLAVIEGLLCILGLISKFVRPDSKFGKFLSKFMKGLYEIEDALDESEDDENSDSKKE